MTKTEAVAQGTDVLEMDDCHVDRCKTCGATWHCADKHVSKVGDVVKHRRVEADVVVEVSKFACPTCMRAGRVDAFEGF